MSTIFQISFGQTLQVTWTANWLSVRC